MPPPPRNIEIIIDTATREGEPAGALQSASSRAGAGAGARVVVNVVNIVVVESEASAVAATHQHVAGATYGSHTATTAVAASASLQTVRTAHRGTSFVRAHSLILHLLCSTNEPTSTWWKQTHKLELLHVS
jgi:hypothetical protein